MTITESRVREIAARHGVEADVAVRILREAGLTVVPDFAGRDARPGDAVPTEQLHACDLVGEVQADGQVWVAKSAVGQRRRFISRDAWYRLAEIVAQAGGLTYLHEPEV
jgi:hypothetical protein